jgi:hypothetical protein
MLVLAMEFSKDETRRELDASERFRVGAKQSLPQNGTEDRPG